MRIQWWQRQDFILREQTSWADKHPQKHLQHSLPDHSSNEVMREDELASLEKSSTNKITFELDVEGWLETFQGEQWHSPDTFLCHVLWCGRDAATPPKMHKQLGQQRIVWPKKNKKLKLKKNCLAPKLLVRVEKSWSRDIRKQINNNKNHTHSRIRWM